MLMQGEGARTVIFEAGLGDTLEVWQHVQPLVASGCTRTLAYNRAGYPGSDPAGGPRDAATIVAELREELQRRNVSPPYVLVGHSLGGLYMQYFARNFPSEVAGLVLIDSTHWNQGMRLDPAANTPYLGRSAVTLFMPWIMRRELSDSAAAGEEVHSSPEVGYLPTIVLSSTRSGQDQTPSARSRAEELQDEIAADFPEARHIRVVNSGHYIQRDQPDVVVEAVRALAGCVTSGKSLTPAP
jgi:pimeloyl-ACP methyl ester carboxylesterase